MGVTQEKDRTASSLRNGRSSALPHSAQAWQQQKHSATPAVGRGFLPGRAAHTTEQSPHKVLPAKPAAQAKGDINPASVQNIAQVGIMPRAHGREPATTLHVEN